MGKQTLTFLGRCSGFGDENNSSYVELENNRFLLIDCGYTVFNKLKKQFDLLKNYDKVEVVITHLHNDHAGTLGHLVSYLFFNCNKKVTVVSKCKNIAEYLDFTGTPREAYILTDHIDDLNLELIETKHSDYLDSYGFKANINNRNILYTGDANNLTPFIPFFDKCDEFYMDSSVTGGSHIKIDEVLDTLSTLKSKGTDVYLMHLQDKEKIREITNNEFNI